MGNMLPEVKLGTSKIAKAIAAGAAHTCALFSDSSVKCWGGNHDGVLGLGDVNTRGDDAADMGDALPTVRAPHKTSRRRPADTRRAPALLGFDVHSHAFILAPWRASVSLAGSVRFCSALVLSFLA